MSMRSSGRWGFEQCLLTYTTCAALSARLRTCGRPCTPMSHAHRMNYQMLPGAGLLLFNCQAMQPWVQKSATWAPTLLKLMGCLCRMSSRGLRRRVLSVPPWYRLSLHTEQAPCSQ